MRDYQPHKNNPYWLEPTVYRRVLALVRDYDRMVRDYNSILHETGGVSDGQPRAASPGDPVSRKVERMDALWSDIRAVETALIQIPAEYRQGVLNNIRAGGWPADVPANRKTWSKWRCRFLFYAAKKMNWL